MFEIKETSPPALLGRADTFEAAMDQLDTECERRHRQVAAGGEGSTGMRYRFEITEGRQTAALLSWAPDVTRPYEPATAAMRGFGEMP